MSEFDPTPDDASADEDAIAAAADTDWPLLRLLRTSGRSHLPYLGVSVVTVSIATIVDMADIFVLGLAFDAMFNDRAYALPLVPAGLIPNDPLGQLWFTVGLLVAMKVTDIAAANVSQYCRNLYTQRVLHDVRVDAFDAAQRLELGFFEDSRTGDVMNVLNDDVNTLEEFLARGVAISIRIVLMIAASLVFMVALNWQLALVVLVATPVIAVVNLWFSRVLDRRQRAVRESIGDLNARLESALGGIAVIKAFAAEPTEFDQVATASDDHRDARWSSKRIAARHRPSMRLVSGTALVLTFSIGAWWVAVEPPLWFTGTLTAGQLIPFLFYTNQLSGPMRWVATVIENYRAGTAAARRIVGVQATDRTVDEGTVDRTVDESTHRSEDPSSAVSAGAISFEDVHFSYPGTDDPVFDGLDLAVEPGETVGIVGTTGAGKSTLVKLLLRFYDVDDGAVRIDGTDVRELSRRRLRRAVGYVDQDPFLFQGTIRDNVAYGDPTADDAAIEQAAREAGVDRFVRTFEDGYDTQVGERGTKLSGGQRQRIAIARAILADPPIVVFDEATSHVDNETEVLLRERMAAVTADRTTLQVAHRLSTVRDADRIVVVDDGSVVEAGTHESLLAADGQYADLWAVQVGRASAAGEVDAD